MKNTTQGRRSTCAFRFWRLTICVRHERCDYLVEGHFRTTEHTESFSTVVMLDAEAGNLAVVWRGSIISMTPLPWVHRKLLYLLHTEMKTPRIICRWKTLIIQMMSFLANFLPHLASTAVFQCTWTQIRHFLKFIMLLGHTGWPWCFLGTFNQPQGGYYSDEYSALLTAPWLIYLPSER